MDCDTHCLIVNHENKKKCIVKIDRLYVAGDDNEYNVRATKKDIIDSKYGTTASLRIAVKGKKKIIVTVEKIGSMLFYSFTIK